MVREGWQAAASRSTLARPSSAQTLGLRGPQYTRVVRTNERTTAALTDLLADDLRVRDGGELRGVHASPRRLGGVHARHLLRAEGVEHGFQLVGRRRPRR